MATDLASMNVAELEAWVEAQGLRAFHARQIFRWLHQRGAASYEGMTDLSKELRARLPEIAPLRQPEIVEERPSSDGAVKYRFRLHDGLEVEGVFIPESDRQTVCISSQVGCGMGCAFCATGTMGHVRNLTAGEIVGQVEAIMARLRAPDGRRPVSNVVFMGMGEPLANLESVIRAAEILLHPLGPGFSRRHVTVSTAGLVPAMEEFVRRSSVKLAVSLNATSDEVRDRIMPVNRRFPLDVLLSACRNLPLQHGDRVTFEYVMLGGVNDSEEDARRLLRLLIGIRAKVNLIPFNAFPGSAFARPSRERVDAFLERLAAGGVSAFVRQSRGASQGGACGQLVTAARAGSTPAAGEGG